MAKSDDRFIEDRLAMIETEGWHDLMADLQTIQEGVVNIDTMTEEKDLWHAKGQLQVLRFILTLEHTTKINLEQSE